MGAKCASGVTQCSTLFGTCSNSACSSSCMKKAQTECRSIEDIIDEQLKHYITHNLHDILEAKFGDYVAKQIESGLVKAVDYDVFARGGDKDKDQLAADKDKDQLAADTGMPRNNHSALRQNDYDTGILQNNHSASRQNAYDTLLAPSAQAVRALTPAQVCRSLLEAALKVEIAPDPVESPSTVRFHIPA